MSRPSATPVIAIDLVRFLCALLVVAYHVDAAYWLDPSPHGQPLLGGWHAASTGNIVTRIGWIGVELFFVVSGMVIARSALDASWPDFLRRRALRLMPAAWVCATITLLALSSAGLLGPKLAAEWVRSMLFWPGGTPIDGSYWTLGVECFFYLLIALVIGGPGTARRLEGTATVLGGISALAWIGCLIDPRLQFVMIDKGATLLLLPHGVFFAIGMTLAAIDGKAPRRRQAALLALLLAGALIEITAHARGRLGSMHVDISAPAAELVFLTGLAMLAFSPVLQAPLSRWISPATARTIGLMTYPLYLIHQDVGAVLIVRLLAAGVPLMLAQVTTVMAMIALAWTIARWPEPWLRARLAAAFRRFRGRAPDNRRTAFPSAG